MKKHAYLLIAHKDDYTFRRLVELLDDERNDIFVHMDAKNSSYDENDTISLVEKAHIIHTSHRLSVNWGGVFSNKNGAAAP